VERSSAHVWKYAPPIGRAPVHVAQSPPPQNSFVEQESFGTAPPPSDRRFDPAFLPFPLADLEAPSDQFRGLSFEIFIFTKNREEKKDSARKKEIW